MFIFWVWLIVFEGLRRGIRRKVFVFNTVGLQERVVSHHVQTQRNMR